MLSYAHKDFLLSPAFVIKYGLELMLNFFKGCLGLHCHYIQLFLFKQEIMTHIAHAFGDCTWFSFEAQNKAFLPRALSAHKLPGIAVKFEELYYKYLMLSKAAGSRALTHFKHPGPNSPQNNAYIHNQNLSPPEIHLHINKTCIGRSAHRWRK